MRRALFAAALLAAPIAAADGANGDAQAAEIDFGSLVPSPGGCTHSGTDPGLVCPNGQVFSSGGNSFTATGYSDAFVTPTFLTLKPLTAPPGPPVNAFNESGIGENATGPGTPCSDIHCEEQGTASVAVVGSVPLTDLIVASAQAGENFELFTGPTIAGLTPFGGVQTCAAVTCEFTFPAAFVIGVESGGVGDVNIASVSPMANGAAAVPEPASLALLAAAVFGLAWWRRPARPMRGGNRRLR